MSARTTFFSKLIGLYLILISLAMIVHKQATIMSMNALVHNAPVLFVVGVIAVAAGLAMVLGHNVWSGGVLPVVVTLTGWLLLIKGSMLCSCRRRQYTGCFSRGFTSISFSTCTWDGASSRRLPVLCRVQVNRVEERHLTLEWASNCQR
jgi:hypothetical protein